MSRSAVWVVLMGGIALAVWGCASGSESAPTTDAAERAGGRARNVVLFLGDGMGVSTVTAARILEGQLRGEPGEENLLAFETLPYTALSRTYNTNQQVADSAGTITAIVAGQKTRAGVLNVTPDVERGDAVAAKSARMPTLFDAAEARGLATGVVTTARLTHATPAACYAYSPERNWEADTGLSESAAAADFPDIARQLVELHTSATEGGGLEVALGGGRANFLPAETADPEDEGSTGKRGDGRDLTAEWLQRDRSAYVWSGDQLAAIDAQSTDHLLGLFHPSHMQFDVDRPVDVAGEPSLAEMTLKAIEILSREERGFVLLVEGGRIDHGHHAGNAYRALTDAIAFSDAVRAAVAATDPDETLVVVTADHSHTLTLGGYPTRGNPILGLVVSNDERGEAKTEPELDLAGKPYTTLNYANGPGYVGATDAQPRGPKRLPHFAKHAEATGGRATLAADAPRDPMFLQEAAVPLLSETHAGEDVVIYAGGPGAERFHGSLEQSAIYGLILQALGWPSD